MQTQVEAIVNIPIQLIIISQFLSLKYNGWRKFIFLLISGILAGIAIQLKLFFVIILISVYGVFFIYDIYYYSLIKALKNSGFILSGFILSQIPFLVYIYQNDISILVFQTFFVYPLKIASQPGLSDINILISSIKGFFKPIIALLIPAIIGILYRRKHLIVICYLIWIASASLVIMMQITSWRQYHFQLLIMPIGVLSALGIDELWNILPRLKSFAKIYITIGVIKALILIMLFLPSSIKISYNLYKKIFYLHNTNSIDLSSYAGYIDEENLRVSKDTYFLLQDNSIMGKIYVAGTPLIYQYSKREQSTALNGWALKFFLPEQWDELANEIENNLPSYIFIDNINKSLFESKGRRVLEILKKKYVFDHKNESGDWFRIANYQDLRKKN